MSPDDEDRDSAPDLPSFEDLVERLEGHESDPAAPAQAEAATGEPADEATGFDDLAEEAEPSDESKWQWGGEPDEPDVREPEPSLDSTPVSDSKSAALLELIDEASNVLVLGPSETAAEYDLCTALCEPDAHSHRRLLVTTAQSADERLNALRGFGADSYDETAIIAVGDQARSSDNGNPATHEFRGETVTIETISDPRDLTRLGLLINKHLGGEDELSPPVICFHTLSSLLQFVEIEKLFRFLHVLQGRVRTSGARAHYHLDPAAHDDAAVHTLRPIFDFTVRFDADGDVAVDT